MDLPVILSGPVLRRVDQSNVFIWIATSKPFQISAKLYQLAPSGKDDGLISDQSEMEYVRFGKRLFVYMIKIVPASGTFPLQTLLGYNLFFTKGSDTVDLSHFGLLEPGADSLVYENLPYPSFFISEGKHTNVLYGSCRKFHGKGEDAMAAGDMYMEETVHVLEKRPQALFLLGDQIYADHVADPLFPVITSLGRELVGKEEPLHKIDKRLERYSSLYKIHGRKLIMDHLCRFTSNQSHNHLIQFSEYAALYVLSWGPQVWEYIQENGGLPVFEEELANDRIHFVFSTEPAFQKIHDLELRQHKQRFAEQTEELGEFIASLKRVRRLMANVPSYMIFDDHDITDDWNLSEEWKENVKNSPLGSHVVANGLGAYWAFQGWGNTPDSFDQPFLKTMKRYARHFDVESESYGDWLHTLWNYPSWHFIAPTEPKTVFLDTRTKRGYQVSSAPGRVGRIMQEKLQSPELVRQSAWPAIAALLKESGWKRGNMLIVASPAPLYGIGLIESALHTYTNPLRLIGIPVHELFDFEAWKYNGQGFTAFLEQIFNWAPHHCFILSGDVHYASSVYTAVESNDGRSAHIMQCTSSPINNASFSGVWGRLMESVARINAFKRKKKSIIRYCDEQGRIVCQEPGAAVPKNCLWKETLQYIATTGGPIMETDNNLGLLSFTEKMAQNHLLMHRTWQKKKVLFNQIDLH
ncbi:hypothetical protein M3221_20255 [Domibacillus indicus]|uniref:hypothetical protein n=1 Tax=Domibacillus indicus TaxID=1437523 RepID=UPI0020418DB7|nr:hypothetical protein [Domibacillus indicus]MCM3790687.1 hypothetical protein [Domibacillus indicus]